MERNFLRKILSAIIAPYLQKNPTAASVLDLIREHEQGPLVYDHVAFRTFAARNPSQFVSNEIFNYSVATGNRDNVDLCCCYCVRSMAVGSTQSGRYFLIWATRPEMNCVFQLKSFGQYGSHRQIACWNTKEMACLDPFQEFLSLSFLWMSSQQTRR